MESNLIAKILLFSGSVIVSLVIAEIGLRVFLPQTADVLPRGFYAADPELGFIQAPQQSRLSQSSEWRVQVVSNSLGLREREVQPKRPEEWRLLVLGDSYTFGLGVDLEEAYPRRIEEALRLATHQDVTVVNAGVPAYGTSQEAIWCERIVNHIQPDAILIGFFVNDFDDNLNRNRRQVVDGYLVTESAHGSRMLLTEWLGIPTKIRIALRTRLHLYVLLMNAWRAVLVKTGWANTDRIFEIYKQALTPDTIEAISATRNALSRLANCPKGNVPLGLVFIPDGRFATVLAGTAGYRFERPAEIVRELATEKEIPVLDLSKTFEKAKDFYFPMDGHWNARGHLLAGRTIAASLREGELANLLNRNNSSWSSRGY